MVTAVIESATCCEMSPKFLFKEAQRFQPDTSERRAVFPVSIFLIS